MSNTSRRVTRTRFVGVAGLVAIAACGDNGVERPGPPPPAKLVVRVEPASVADCPFGGSVVSSGIDENRNGVLDDDEVAKRTPLCNDPPAAAPPRTVVRLVPELRGEHCALDGTAVQSGLDRNSNGVLDDDEVDHIEYACGEVMRTRIIAVPLGATCVAGGVAFQVGRDRDRDGVLGDGEVEQTRVECGSELSSDVAIASAADAAALARITVIEGAVTLDATGVGELALPALTVVRGALEIRNEPALAHLAMPVLQSVGGRFALTDNPRLASVELPLLSRVGSLVIEGDPALPDLTGMAALGNVPGDVQITNNAALTAADLPLRGGPGGVTIDGNAQLALLAACGDPAPLGAPSAGPPPPPVVVRIDAASAVECPHGGSVVSSGLDDDGNGVLDDAEVANRSVVCRPGPMPAPPEVQVRLVAEPRGNHCSAGGTAVESGLDDNRNGVLDDGEVTHIDYACGRVLVTRIDAEPPGVNCSLGGVVFLAGRDRDGDNQSGNDNTATCGPQATRG